MGKHFIKTICLALVLVMMVSLVLVGCGEQKQPDATTPAASAPASAAASTPEAPAEPVTITFWHTYGDAEEPYINDTILPLFQQQFPNITVESLRQENDQFTQLITTALGTGTNPDVARIEITNLAGLVAQDAILPLDDMEGFADIKGQVLAGPLGTNFIKGKYYGLPIDTNCKAAVMNMNVMKKLGFTEPPKTMEEIIDASKKNSPGVYTINVSGVGDWDLFPYFWLFGGKLTDDGYTKATGFMDSAESIAALQAMMDIHKDKVFTIRDLDGTPDAWDAIKKDQIAMFLEGPWFFGGNADYKDKNITYAPVPTYKGKSATVVGGEDIMIFKNSKHPKEAFEFVKFMLSETVQNMLAAKGQMPVLNKSAESNQIKADPVLSCYATQLQNSFSRIQSAQNTTIVQLWKDEVTKALQGQQTAEATLKGLATKIDAELAK